MIYRNKRDKEAWVREKSIDSMKANTYIVENDIIEVSSGNFYKAIKTTTSIPLKNNLFAQLIPSEIVGNIATATKLKTPRNIALTGDVTGNANFDGSANATITATVGNDSHTHSNGTITSLDASKVNTGVLNVARIPNLDANKITSGTISIERLPQGALERCIVVTDDTARFKLTTTQIQQGDTVKVTATNKMYFVVDTSKLNSEAGYTVYTAGTATEVPWSGVTGKPSTMPNPQALTISLNGASQGAYNGSAAKNINVTPSSIGAYAKGETYSRGEVDTRLNGKANTSHGNHVPTPQSANNKVFLRNDNTWQTITPQNIGAQPAGSYAAASHTHPATQITQDGSHRFITDTERNSWNSKAAGNHNHDTVYFKKYTDGITKETANNINLADGFYNIENSEMITGYGSYFNLLSWGFYSNGTGGARAQLAVPYQFGNPTNSELFIRVSENNSWKTPWRRVWNDGNFNPNSKANVSHTHPASQVTQDGNNRFVTDAEKNKWNGKADAHSHPYLNLSGGTVDGNVNVLNLKATGLVTCSDCVTTSDERLKKDIVKIDNALEKVNKLNGYTFLKAGDKQRTTGVLAQELNEVLPEAVFEREDGYYAVTYGNIVGLLIEAIKELQGEVKRLKGDK